MNHKELLKAQYPCQFSKNNLVGAITFMSLAIFIFISVFAHGLYKENQKIELSKLSISQSMSQLRSQLAYEKDINNFNRHYIKHLEYTVEKYKQERMLTVSVSAYTNRVTETDSTPNLTATLDKVVAGYTVAVSHDLRYLLGHKVYIYGLGVYLVNDLMDDRWSMKVDVYFDKSQLKLAKKFGLKKNIDLVVLHKVGDLKYEKRN